MRFNKTVDKTPNAVSYEGGKVYEKNALGGWMNFLFSDFMEGSFYESAADRQERFANLTREMVKSYGTEFVRKAAYFARNELGMRSVSQLVAAILNEYSFEGKRDFFARFPHRPDDVAEVFAAVEALNGKRSHAMVRGFGDYLSNLNPYQMGKYKMRNRTYTMKDCIFITHANSSVIDKFLNEGLTVDTWETAISNSQSNELRDKEWIRLVEEHKLGYFALIRNLNNILDCPISISWIEEYLVPQLINKESIKKSLIFPYQIYCAYKNLKVRNIFVVAALAEAFRIAVGNMPVLSGDTCILLDVSGSMESSISYKSNITIKEVGAVYATAIFLQNPNCDFIKFGNYAKRQKFSPLDNPFDIVERMMENDDCGYGTDVEPAYKLLNRHYERIFLISDMQIMDNRAYYSWRDRPSGKTCYNTYCLAYGDTELYSFDLGNYKTQTDNPNNPHIHLCTALNDKVVKFITLLEDGESLYDYINKTVID